MPSRGYTQKRTQKHTHAHTHTNRRAGGSRTEVHPPGLEGAPDRTTRTARTGRGVRGLRGRRASESRGSNTLGPRLQGSDGAPLGGSEREGAARVTPAAAPPSESRTEAHEVAPPAPLPAVRSFGTAPHPKRPRADGAGRTSELQWLAAGRAAAVRARSARRGTRPLVLVPYLQNRRQRPPKFVGAGRVGCVRCVSCCHQSHQPFFLPVKATQRGETTSQTVLTATEAEKHVLCLHDFRLLKNLGALQLWRPRTHCLEQRLTARFTPRRHDAAGKRPRNLHANPNVSETSPELPQLLTVAQFAQRLALCRRSVERLIAAQEIRAFKIGRSTRIAVSELVRFVAKLQSGDPSNGGAA